MGWWSGKKKGFIETMELALSTKDWIDWAWWKAGRGKSSLYWWCFALLSNALLQIICLVNVSFLKIHINTVILDWIQKFILESLPIPSYRNSLQPPAWKFQLSLLFLVFSAESRTCIRQTNPDRETGIICQLFFSLGVFKHPSKARFFPMEPKLLRSPV